MGYNTVAFLLNDYMHELQKSPQAVVFGLTHPPMSNDERDQARWRDMVRSVAVDHNEPIPHFQALEMLGTFHADFHKFIVAGGNCISELKFVRYSKSKDGKKLVTLELPEWWRHGFPEKKGEKKR